MSSQTSSTASPATTDQGNTGPSPPTTSSSLYLYTFLATLLLLLGISAVIVIRSLLLRRRTRRMIAAAIANGTWIPPAPRTNIKLGEKPSLYDAYTNVAHEEDGDASEKKTELWITLKPLSATFVRSDNTHKIEQLEIQEPPSTTPTDRLRSLVSRVIFSRRAPQPQTPPFTTPTTEIDSPSHPPEYKEVTVSVMIAMPIAPELKRMSKHDHGASKHECPAVEFGVANLQLPPGWVLEPSASPSAGVE